MSETTTRELPRGAARLGYLLACAGLLLVAAAYAVDPVRAAFANVIGHLFLTSLGVGAVFLIALEYIGGAVWSVPTRRVTEFLGALALLIPLVAAPLFFHLHDVFHWTHAEAVSADRLLQGKSPYLNVPFFMARFGAAFVLWTLFYLLFVRNSVRQDATRDPHLTTWNIRLAAAFLPVFAVTLTVTVIDWAMSLEPHWYSTILGVYYFSGTVLTALAATTYICVRFNERGYFPALRRDHFYSFGALLFAFTNFWAYIAFSQFLLIWYANLPEETVWFMHRWHNGWQYFSVLMIVVRFAVPYVVLLPQDAKMDPRKLKFMALWILAGHLMDLFWLVMPTLSPVFSLSWVDLGFPILIGGLVLLMLQFRMKRVNLVPLGDPRLQRGLDFRL
jgi:hypothetical protein